MTHLRPNLANPRDSSAFSARANPQPSGARGDAPTPYSKTIGVGAPRTAAPARNGAAHADLVRPDLKQIIIERLEEAGGALLALPPSGYTTALRQSRLDIVRAAAEAYGYDGPAKLRPAMPSAATISRMDEAFAWLRLIPDDRYVLRRIAGARAMVNPLTEKHLYPWRRLGSLLGADHRAVQRWHADAIAIIARALAASCSLPCRDYR